LNYSARISLDRAQMRIDNRTVNLSPGMAVTPRSSAAVTIL
jgi:hemolysin D